VRVQARGAAARDRRAIPAEVPSMIDELPLLACLAVLADGRDVVAARPSCASRRATGSLRWCKLRAVGAKPRSARRLSWCGRRAAPLGWPGHDSWRPSARDGRSAVLGALPGNRLVLDDPRASMSRIRRLDDLAG
jgi:hypothetical protein